MATSGARNLRPCVGSAAPGMSLKLIVFPVIVTLLDALVPNWPPHNWKASAKDPGIGYVLSNLLFRTEPPLIPIWKAV